MNSHHQHPDLRSDLVVGVVDLGRRAGEMKRVERTIPAPEHLGIDMIGVPQGSDLALDLRLESVVEGVLVTGTAEADLVGQCSRCLTDIGDREIFDVQELYYWPGRDAEEDALFVEDETIDLEPSIRNAVVLDLPFSPLCKDDCLGLCLECGADLNDEPDHSHGPKTDPRWDQLANLDFDQHEVKQGD